MGQCPNCGRPVDPDATTCAACGIALGTLTPPPPADMPPAREAPPATTASPPPPTDMGPPPGGAGSPSLDEQRAIAAAQQAAQFAGTRQLRELGPPRPRRSPLRTATPALVALGLGLLIQWMIRSVVPTDAYVHRLFRPAGGWIMSIVPGLILFLLLWTLTELFLKYRVGRANDRDLNRPEVKQLPMMVAQEPIEVTLQRLRGWDQRLMSRPVGRRVVWLMRHLGATSDVQRMHELLRHQSDLDTDAAASGYRTATLFIWAMPILGFVGTVLGISLAVGGFSEFLTTSVSIDEIDSVTAELGNVASGLSFAFDTTLLGLLGGLVASVVSSGVKEREERLLTSLDELGLRIMENSTPATDPRPAATPVTGSAELEAVYARLEDLSRQMQAFSQAMRSGLEGLNEASARMSDGLSTSIGSVRGTVEQLGQSLHGVSQSLAGSVSGLTQKVAASESEVRAGLDSLRETNQRLEAALASTVERLATTATTIETGVQAQAAAIEAGARAQAAAVDAGARAQAAAVEAEVQSRAATQRAVEQLSSSILEFGQRLAEFRDAQEALAPALNRLAGPMEIRLMPAQGSSD